MEKNMHIFVFGSNREGRHGRGAALEARLHHGAQYGNPRGLQGNSYAIITKELRRDHPPVTLSEISLQVPNLYDCARAHPSWTFQLTPIGCGLAGFTPAQIAPLFRDAPPNILMPREFLF